MKKIYFYLLLCFMLVSGPLLAQRNKLTRAEFAKENVNFENKWGVFINTLSVLEPQQAAVGAGVNYKIAPRWDVSAELNYLFEGFWQGGDDYTSKGMRGVFTVKRFSKNGLFFYGLDTRIKYFSFVDRRSFVNRLTSDTLTGFTHNASNTLYGMGGLVGFRLPISKNKKWAFEINTGYGAKYRLVNRKNIPSGYEYLKSYGFKKHYDYTSDQDINGWTFYFPTAWRVVYLF